MVESLRSIDFSGNEVCSLCCCSSFLTSLLQSLCILQFMIFSRIWSTLDKKLLTGGSREISLPWTFYSDKMSPSRGNLFQLNDFLRQVVSVPWENDPLEDFSTTVWHNIRATCSTWLISPDTSFCLRRKNVITSKKTLYNLTSAGKRTNW